jgi:hypothetical protein
MAKEGQLNCPLALLQDRAYSQELDSDFYGTNFEIYHVSKRTKRKGGSGASEWCGGLQLSVRQSNWIQKNIFQANGSAGKFGPQTVVYLASRVCRCPPSRRATLTVFRLALLGQDPMLLMS